MANKPQNYLLHLLGCLLFISLPILLSPDLFSKQELINVLHFRRSLLTCVLLIVFFYGNYIYLIPRFYFTHRYLVFFLCLAVCFVVIALLPEFLLPGSRGMRMHIPPNMNAMPPGMGRMPPMGDMRPPGMRWHNFPRFGFILFPLLQEGSQFLLVFSLSLFLRINQRLAHIQSEKLKTEVSYLRAQINPHFLFNTLNSLYALTLEKSDAAPEAVLKLSSMMRYVVTESGRDRVALDNEINYIKNYISLQRLRMDGGTPFTFIITGDGSGKYISPLLLIPFIENAFKYGLNPEEDTAINIHIDINDTGLALNVKNNKVTVDAPAGEQSGHGIENTRQRLEYLYPDKHKLTIFDTEQHFEVQLSLTLV